MKTVYTWAIILASCLFASQVQAAAKGDEPESLQFLHQLQQNGYGDFAVEYLKILEKQSNLPAAIRDVFDLEMSESLRAAADASYDEKESEQFKAESRKFLDKFLKEHPDHPAADGAVASSAEFELKQAIWRIQSAKALESKDKAKYAKEMSEVRVQLGEVRKKFVEAAARFQKQADKLPQFPEQPSGHAKPTEVVAYEKAFKKVFIVRDRVEASLHGVLWQTAMTQYQLAQTYPAKSKEQIEQLKKAKAELDKVYQKNRSVTNQSGRFVVALLALLWEGKIAEELGDATLALDIYEEVLACAPDAKTVAKNAGHNDPMEMLYTQVAFFRFQILAQKKPKPFLEEARAWLKEHDASEKTDGYQGVALETAKTLVKVAETANAIEKRKCLTDAKRILKDMAGVSSPHHQDAVQLRRKLLNAGTGAAASEAGVEANNYEDAVAQGDAFLEEGQLTQARDAYRKALEFAAKKGQADASKTRGAVEGLCKAQLRLAVGLYKKKSFDECLTLLDTVVYDDAEKKIVRKDIPTATMAASLAVNVALTLYADATDDKRPAALAKLTAKAKIVEDNWPTRPEADDARMTLARVQYSLGKVRDAVEVFDKVNPKSERYPLAMYRAGQIYASLYWEQKKKPAGECDSKQMAADRAKAISQLKAGLEVLDRRREPGKPLPENFTEMQLLLANIHLDGSEMKEAAALFQTLIDIFKEEKRDTFDDSTIGIFRGAVQAYAALGEVEKAGAVGAVLLDIGPDKLQANGVLVDFARRLEFERRSAVAAVTKAEGDNKSDELAAARKKLASLEKMLGMFLEKLAKRQEISLAGMVFLGDALNAVNKTAEAGAEYKKILDRAASDPDFAKTAKSAITRVRAQLVGLLRKDKKYEEALKEVDQLLKTNPRALEPLMERGYILEGLAENNPALFKDAVAHWAKLRGMLQNVRPKPPGEYYDVIYNVAKCLMAEAEKSNDKTVKMDRWSTAEKVLKSTLVLNSKLNGPDTVARYRVLLNRAITLQGRVPEEK